MGGDPLPVVGDPLCQVLPVHGPAPGSDHLCLLLPGDRCLLVSPKVELKSLFLVLLVFQDKLKGGKGGGAKDPYFTILKGNRNHTYV